MKITIQRRRWAWRLVCAGLFSLAGCQNLNTAEGPNDPFLGPKSTRIPPTQIPAEVRPTANNASSQGNTNAALASGFRPANPTNAQPVSRPPNTPPDFTTPPSNNVQPAAHPPWNNPPTPNTGATAAAPTTPPTGLTWEQARGYLASRGVTQQRLEMREGVWHFECFIPDPVNPAQLKMYRAAATTDIEAVKAVLEKMQSGR